MSIGLGEQVGFNSPKEQIKLTVDLAKPDFVVLSFKN